MKSIYRKIPINTEISYEDETTVLHSFNKFLLRSTNTLQALFSDYTRDRCHVAIKTFNRKDNMITTVARDEVSPSRGDKDENPNERSRPYWKNSAFTRILENERCSFYYSNWLVYRACFKKYHSGHDGWQRLYNAAIIVPITTRRSASMVNSSTVVGFICVDNRAGRFNGRDCAELLFAFARAYCDLFDLVGRIHHKRQADEGTPTSGHQPRYGEGR